MTDPKEKDNNSNEQQSYTDKPSWVSEEEIDLDEDEDSDGSGDAFSETERVTEDNFDDLREK